MLNAENFHPGKGTPTTQVDMRRISDGVKTAQRYKTTDQVERAHVEDNEYSFLYKDGDGFHFMNQENYEQVHGAGRHPRRLAVYLQEGMVVSLALHEGIAVSIELPQKVTLEIIDTEPAMKGQTASGSFKPAKLSNGVRTMVPTHITTGTARGCEHRRRLLCRARQRLSAPRRPRELGFAIGTPPGSAASLPPREFARG